MKTHHEPFRFRTLTLTPHPLVGRSRCHLRRPVRMAGSCEAQATHRIALFAREFSRQREPLGAHQSHGVAKRTCGPHYFRLARHPGLARGYCIPTTFGLPVIQGQGRESPFTL